MAWYSTGIAAVRNEKPDCPVQSQIGEKDCGLPFADIEAIRNANSEIESFVYAGGGYGFGCEERSAYVKADAEGAQRRTLDFFKKNLACLSRWLTFRNCLPSAVPDFCVISRRSRSIKTCQISDG